MRRTQSTTGRPVVVFTILALLATVTVYAESITTSSAAARAVVIDLDEPAINWSNVTSDEMRSISPDVFSSITETEAASIPAAAFAGLKDTQAAAFDGVACGGLSAAQIAQVDPGAFKFSISCVSRLKISTVGAISEEQLAQLTPESFEGFGENFKALSPPALQSLDSSRVSHLLRTACEQISAELLVAVNPDGFAGLKFTCASSIAPEAFRNISAIQLAHFSADALEALSAEQLQKIPGFAMKGLSSQQIAALTPAAAAGLTAAQVAALPAEAFAGFRIEFVARVPSSAWAEISAAQLSNLNAFSGLDADMVARIPSAAFEGVSAKQLSDLTVDGDKVHACRGLDGLQMKSLRTAAIGGLTEACIQATNHTAWSLVSEEQISALAPAACAGLRWYHLARGVRTAAYAGFTASCIAQIGSNDALDCKGFVDTGVLKIKPPAFAGFTPACWEAAIQPDLTSAQFSYVSPAVLAQMPNQTVSRVNPSAFAGLSKEQVAALQCRVASSSPDVEEGSCTGLLSDQISHIKPSSMGGFSDRCVRCSLRTAWKSLTSEQLRAMSPSACGAFMPIQRLSMSIPTFSGYTSECIAASEAENFIGMTPQQLAKIPPQAFVGFTAAHVDAWKWTRAESGLSAEQLSYLDPSACFGFTPMHVATMNANTFAGIRSACLNVFQNTTVAALSPAQVDAIPAESFTSWHGVIDLNSAVFDNLKLAQVQHIYVPVLPAEIIKSLLRNFTLDLVNSWTAETLANVSIDKIISIKHAVAFDELPGMLDDLPADEASIAASTWLQWAVIKRPESLTECTSFNYTASMLESTPAQALAGLQPWKMPCFPVETWASLSSQQAKFILSDAALVITPAQFTATPTASLKRFRPETWAALNPFLFRAISAERFRDISLPSTPNATEKTITTYAHLFYSALTCAQIGEIHSDQLVWMPADTLLRMFRLVRGQKCPNLPPLGLVNAVPALLPPGYSDTTPALWIGVGITCFVVIVAVPGIIFLGKWLRAHREGTSYWALPQSDFAGAFDDGDGME